MKHARSNNNLFRVAGLTAAGASLFSLAAKAQETILSDGFTQGNPGGGALIGVAPDGTNLGGGVWGYAGRNDYDNREFSGATYFTNTPNFAASRNGTAAAISIMSNGTYVEPDLLTISAGVNPLGPTTQGTNNPSGTNTAYLGFYSATQSSHYQVGTDTNLTGLSISTTGAINFDVNGSTSPTDITATFNSDGFAPISFSVLYDAATGAAVISNLTVNGVSYAADPTDTFTAIVNPPAGMPTVAGTTAISYAGFGGTGGGFPAGSSFTDLVVTGGVPEPSTYELLAAGAVALGATQFRRRQNP